MSTTFAAAGLGRPPHCCCRPSARSRRRAVGRCFTDALPPQCLPAAPRRLRESACEPAAAAAGSTKSYPGAMAMPSRDDGCSLASEASFGRRRALGFAAAVAGGLATIPAARAAEDAPPAGTGVLYRGRADASVSQISYGFELVVPAGYLKQTAESLSPNSTVGLAPRSLYGDSAAPASPLVARFVSPDRRQVISVAVVESSSVRPTFLQPNDITDWGAPEEVGPLLLSRDSSPAGPPADTAVPESVAPRLSTFPFQPGGSAAGDDDLGASRHYYRFDFLLPGPAGGAHGLLLAGIKAGKLYVAAATSPVAAWGDQGPSLAASLASFRIT